MEPEDAYTPGEKAILARLAYPRQLEIEKEQLQRELCELKDRLAAMMRIGGGN